MAKTQDWRDTVLYLSAQGLRARHVNSVSFSVAAARTNNTAPNRIMADMIQGDTEVFPIFTAPCNARVLRIYANGTPFIDNGVAETTVATTSKSVIGGADVALGAGITIGSATVPTLNTAIDDVLTGGTTMDLLEGQHVFTTVVVGATVQSAVAYVTLNVEWVPTEQ